MSMIYNEFRTWRMALGYRCKMLFGGIYGLLVHVLLFGVLSVLAYVGRQVGAFFRRELIAGCIIVAVIASMTLGWMVTFVKERDRAVTAQHRADSLAYDLSKFTQMYDTTDIIIINGDTVKSR